MSELISIVIPLYNQGSFLKEAISSLQEQSYKTWEAIIVNDGSTDHSGDVADAIAKNDSRIKVVHRVNGGLAAARNTGLDHVTGSFVGLLDSDDYYLPSFLEELSKPLRDNQEMSLTWCKPQETDARLQPIKPFIAHSPLYSTSLTAELLAAKPALRLVWDNPLIPCAQMWRSSLIRNLRYDESYRSNEDWDIACRLEISGGKFCFVSGVHSLYRRHGSSLNNNQRRMIETRIRCGVKNYAKSGDNWIAGLSSLSLVLGATSLQESDDLFQMIPGDAVQDGKIIDRLFDDELSSPFAILWCGGIVRRKTIVSNERSRKAVKRISQILPYKFDTWKAAFIRLKERISDMKLKVQEYS